MQLTITASRFARAAGQVAGTTYSVTAWRTLAGLETAGPQRVSDLAAGERVAQPSMTGLVSRLVDDGWVVREPDPADGRATLVRLTADGVAALNRYRAATAARIRPALDELSPEARATLARAAELLAQITESPSLRSHTSAAANHEKAAQ